MLIAFFDIREIVHTKFMAQGQTINQMRIQRHLATFDAFNLRKEEAIVRDKVMAAPSRQCSQCLEHSGIFGKK